MPGTQGPVEACIVTALLIFHYIGCQLQYFSYNYEWCKQILNINGLRVYIYV